MHSLAHPSASTPDQPHHIETHDQWAHRNVTLICGPPGSGKSTLARQLHVHVVELENFHHDTMRASLRAFGLAAYKTGRNPLANVAIVRGAPSERERQHQRDLCHPARTIILLTPADICHARIDERGRPEAAGEHAAVDKWWDTYRGVNMPAKQRGHYSGEYKRRAAAVRAAANADPTTVCWRCGRTLAEHKQGDTWQAGHVIDANPASELRPEARSCNAGAGAAAGNRRRVQLVQEPRSRQWDA